MQHLAQPFNMSFTNDLSLFKKLELPKIIVLDGIKKINSNNLTISVSEALKQLQFTTEQYNPGDTQRLYIQQILDYINGDIH